MLYITILIFLFVLSYIYDYRLYPVGRKESYCFCLIIFVLVAGLRYRLGFDSIQYQNEYTYYPSILDYFSFDFSNQSYGRGFLFMYAVSKLISDEFFIFQIIQSAFVNSIIFSFFYKNNKHIFFSLILYSLMAYFNYSFETLRESCAIALFLISWKYMLNNNWIKYYLLCSIALLFHTSAIVTLIIPLFYFPYIRDYFKINTKFILMLVMAGCVSLYITTHFYQVFSRLNISFLMEYVIKYEMTKFSQSSGYNVIGFAVFFIIKLFYPILSLLILKKSRHINIEKNNSDYINKLQFLLCWFIIFSFMSLFVKIFYRFANYFMPFVIVLMSGAAFSSFTCIKKQIRLSFGCWIIIFFPYIFLVSYGFFQNDGYSNEWLIRRYYPYESIITQGIDSRRENSYYSNGR